MRKPFDFIIVSTPFPDYNVIGEILSLLGASCTTEKSINDWWAVMDVEKKNKLQGDLSWYAVPYLDYFPNSTLILHQTISPTSHLMTNEKLFSNWDSNYTESFETDYSSNKFVKYQGREWNWPEAKKDKTEMFYVKWNQLIEEKSKNKKYMRFKVEDLGQDLIERIAWFIGLPITDELVNVLSLIKTNKRVSKERIDKLKVETQSLARKYDYFA